MSSTSEPIWIIPDTNILIGELKSFIDILSRYRDRNIIIGIPQILVEEKSQSLYTIVCGYQKATNEFQKHLNEILSEFEKKHLQVEIVPIIGVYGISRYGMSYYGGEKSKDFMTQTIQKYLDEKYIETPKYLEHCGLKIDQRDYLELFYEGLSICCSLSDSANESCRDQCETLHGVLADILILSAVDYPYQRGNKVIVVSNDKTMCKTANELVKEEFFDEKYVKCVAMEGLEEILKKSFKLFKSINNEAR